MEVETDERYLANGGIIIRGPQIWLGHYMKVVHYGASIFFYIEEVT